MALPRPAYECKQIGLLLRPRKIPWNPEMTKPFFDSNRPLQLRKGWINIYQHLQNTPARNNSIKMEVILFTSLYRAIEVLIFYIHFFIEELSIYVVQQRWSSLSFIWKRLQAAKNSEVYVDALRGHLTWILHYRGCIHLTATSSGRFNLFFPSHRYALTVLLRAMRGHLLRLAVSLTVLNGQSK